MEENQTAYAYDTVTKIGSDGCRGTSEHVRPRGLTKKHVQVERGGAGARATVATAAYYLPTDLPTCLPTYLLPTDPTDRLTDRLTDLPTD